ncbi:MAG: aminotransferase class V-fold PLP-dependent enzyme [bacterium]
MNKNKPIYFDNAATSFPKPPGVAQAVAHFINEIGANPGRSGHRASIEAARVLFGARELVAQLFNVPGPNSCVFTSNATESLNLALKGLLRPGDHAITTGMEHNSVMRPLRALEAAGVSVTVVPCSAEGKLTPADVATAIRPDTKLVVMNHASNVSGTLLPVRDIGRVCREKDILLIVDCAQTGGCFPIDVQADMIDLLAFTGHKGLLGPQGTGGLVVGGRVDIAKMAPLKQGGTGSGSEYEMQPGFMPDAFEAGTPNTPGIAGLAAGLEFVLSEGVDAIHTREQSLMRNLIALLRDIPGLNIIGDPAPKTRVATVAFNIGGLSPSDIGFRLDDEFGILCRVGLHCSPAAHKTLGTFPAGAVRFGLSYFSTDEEIERAADALRAIAAGKSSS